MNKDITVEDWLGKDNQLGIDIWNKKYRQNDETFMEWVWRVSGGDNDIAQLIIDKKFLFGGRILANRGLDGKHRKITMSNCYVTKTGDSIEEIFDTAAKIARTFSYGGGIGLDLSTLSPRGAHINNAAKTTSGAVSFMDLYSTVTGLIGQEGRRGALMLSLSCDHPDIEEFIDIKNDLNKVTYANISVRVTDAFMKAVKADADFTLTYQRIATGETITRTVRAREIFDKLAKNNWETGEPGVLFWDRIKNWNMIGGHPNFEFAGTNPCFTADMKLLTADGYKTFGELTGTEVDLINLDGHITRGRVFCSGRKETVEIKLSDKQIIKCTPDHVFMTINGDECKAKDLLGKKLMPFVYPYNKHDNTYLKLGFIQGDGQLSRLDSPSHLGLEVNIGQKDTDIADLFSNDDFTCKSERVIYLSGYSELLRELQFSHKTLPERTMPQTYSSWGKRKKEAFLCGCFSANGCVIGKARVAYKTTCHKFAVELQNTLKKDFDISTYITRNKPTMVEFSNGVYETKTSYDLNIARFSDIMKFNNSIGFYQNYKKVKMQELLKERALTVRSIKENGICTVYDFTEPERHWGVVNDTIVHNCGELPLPSGGACLLGSINLSEYIIDETTKMEFDMSGFARDVGTCVRALNCVLDEGIHLHPLQEQRESAARWRQIGLGIMGLADLLIKLGISYGSDEAIALCDKIGREMINAAMTASANLAIIDGPYPGWSEVENHDFVFSGDYFNEVAGDFTSQAVKSFGLRNAQLLTVAPTGTLSTMLGISGGIEPIFADSYTRTTKSLHQKDVAYKVYTPIVEQFLAAHGLAEDSELPEYFVTAKDIDYHNRIEMQAAFQKYIDSSISSTVNVPHEFTVEQVKDLYTYAWENGLKGITIFRDGCRRTGILNAETPEDDAMRQTVLSRGDIIECTDDLIGKKRKLTTGCGTIHCQAWFDPVTGDLMETFIPKGGTGGCRCNEDAVSRMISLASRGGVCIESIVDQLSSCGGCDSYRARTVTKNDTSKGSSCPTAMAYAILDMHNEVLEELGLSETYDWQSPAKPEKNDEADSKGSAVNISSQCPECGEALAFEGGCNICRNCGWSKCG